ncbi:alpha-hydroxy-acid oxidizing protein [Spirosoma sp. HMF4905]|uniref:Alpha-hydroxy-acid oxidizing protein n=1 Tax=Spirosoma arboris TaxID=2682092 RepID=A0A7K1SLE3_9BACT|nr:alpha-hydroxy acid oxidase [Spirosoma arboris]MVM34503.1 alpha-hydroxy-acid oxidizing protein [Spirosoma arboris]
MNDQHNPEFKPTKTVPNTHVDLSDIINLFDLEKRAAEIMTKMAYEYVASGAADELTVRWNRESLDNLKLNPSVLRDVSQLDTRISLFGDELPYPILIAPTAFHKIMHPEGELATARGAGVASATYVISSFTTTPLEEIAEVATQPLWFQLYVQDDRSLVKDLVQKAEAVGCRALCVTVDTPVPGIRNRQDRVNFRLPDEVKAPYMHGLGDQKKLLTWADIDWLNSFSNIPVLLKGILNPADAEQAVQAGVSGIIVSNHSGRNLDTVPATIDVLPGIANQVNKRVPLLMDGGIRRGTDVLKALAQGADAVLVGKPVCFGLACGGADGVSKVMTILRTEFELAMTLTGRTTIASIDRSVIWKPA